MKVFVTGVAGFLGSHVAERLRDGGHEVRGIDNLAGGELGNVPTGVEFRQLDCLDRAAYLDLMAGCDLVYHCAAAAYDGLSLFSPSYVFLNTAQATVDVASAAVASGVGRFVHCSSMARYGDVPTPYTEDQVVSPVTPYGHAKRVSELVVTNLVDSHGGEWAVAVPHNIIGPRQRFDDPYRNVAAIMVNRMLRGLQPVLYGDGSHRRCFSFVDDVIYCLEQMATSPAAAGEVINIGPDEGTVTILELAEEIADLLAFPLDPISCPTGRARSRPPPAAPTRRVACSGTRPGRPCGTVWPRWSSGSTAAARATSSTTSTSRSPPRAPRGAGSTS